VADIADKIKDLLSNKKLQEKLRKEGPHLAKTYSWSEMAKETLEVYKLLMRQHC